MFGGRVQDVREPAAGDALRDDGEATVRAALDRARPREPLVLELGDNRQPFAQRRFEHGQFGPQDQPLEHVPCLTVEGEHTSPEAVFEARRRLRRLGIQGRRGHVHGAQQVCNGRTIMPVLAIEDKPRDS